MKGFVILSTSCFLYFTLHILDQGVCDATSSSLNRKQNKKLKYALFKDHFFHALLVPKVQVSSVQTGKHCLLQCVKNEGCFSTNVGAFPRPDGNVTCELLSTDKYNASEKFQANHTFHHYSIVSPCESFPCKNGGTCRALYETDEYNCSCTQDFNGNNCEFHNVSSCKELFDKSSGNLENKAYPIHTDAGQQLVYCHFSNLGDCGPGPWTMVMKIDGFKNTFGFYSTYWKDKNILNPEGGKTGFDFEETKLATYWRTNFTKLCLGTKFQNQNRFIAINKTAESLYSLIANDQPCPTSLGRNTWKKLFGDQAELEPNCNSEGFNPVCYNSVKIRIGIFANDADNCHQCGTYIAFGGMTGCLNLGFWSSNQPNLQKAMGYILVK